MLSEDEIRQYTARQYDSLREESKQAREAQHNILQWSQAVSGTLFAAGLLAGTSHSGRYLIAARFIFGLVLPAVLLGGALAWAGEMIRMERTGVFLRSFERAMWRLGETTGQPIRTSWFIWENFLWAPPKKFFDAGYRKQNSGYAGLAIFYSVMYGGSLVVFCVLSPWWLSLIECAVSITVGIVAIIPSAVQVFALGGMALTITSDELAGWAKELEDAKSTLAQMTTLQRVKRALVRERGRARES